MMDKMNITTSPLINNGFLPSSIRTESTSSTIAKLNGFGLFIYSSLLVIHEGKKEPQWKKRGKGKRKDRKGQLFC